ncbi:dihydrofolate reductase family protein [Pseudonocardia humida]|uniref:Dihydrofolate reductase n=1 Tax=Pseudonocardia humida TaxID=2800819 RepID=A0ABT1A9T1_9PSEU|nr:dihydrofolate reductase family protein [Pseudonocardia humida]MCO1659419.1 dihydrofolate reductase [Pseudonocardia humida]
MRELTYFVAVSLDGFIAAPDDTFDAFPVQGDHIDWIFREWVDTLPTPGLEMVGLKADNSRFDTVLMGWKTYAAGGVPNPYQHLRQYVFSRREREVPDDIHLTDRDPVEVVRELKAEPDGSGIWLCGGGQLAGTLVEEIDRFVFKVNPLLLGAGIPLFADRAYDPRALTRVASLPFESGVVVNEYVRG